MVVYERVGSTARCQLESHHNTQVKHTDTGTKHKTKQKQKQQQHHDFRHKQKQQISQVLFRQSHTNASDLITLMLMRMRTEQT
jgi:ABC-type lipoprotein release transport system permease subunit